MITKHIYTLNHNPARKLTSALALGTLLAGCASVPHPTPGDPLERYNRSMFTLNEAVDKAVFKPLAKGYRAITPTPVRTCVSNIFNNVGDLFSSLHSFLQGRGHDGINSFGRVLMNSTLGLGGCLDLASKKGVPRIPNDLGTTLGVWGVGSGPYVVLPLLGSSSVRDGLGTGASSLTHATTSGAVIHWVDNVPVRNGIVALNVVDLRTSLLQTEDMVDSVALDRYSFIRDAYLQRRAAMIQGQFGYNSSPAKDAALPDYEDFDDADEE